MSECLYMKDIKPLRQDNLSEGGNEREVHGLKESGFLTPATSGSFTQT